MIFKVSSVNDDLIQSAYDEGMQRLNDFWGINWIKNTPDLYIIENRADINKIKGRETESWVVGWAASTDSGKNIIYLLDFDKLETESDHKKDEAKYRALITHELCHLFVSAIEKKSPPMGPMWWNEGISTYLSGQLLFKKRPEKFIGFLDSNRENPRPAYNEGGFVIELLVEKFGKDKLIEMLTYLRDSSPTTTFKDDFNAVYGFELSYEKINELYLENK